MDDLLPPHLRKTVARLLRAAAERGYARGLEAGRKQGRKDLLDAAKLLSSSAAIEKAIAGPSALWKAFSEDDHPRGKDGRFISQGDIDAAKTDPAKAAELRDRVKPEDAGKLDARLDGTTGGDAANATSPTDKPAPDKAPRARKDRPAVADTLDRVKASLGKPMTAADAADLARTLGTHTAAELAQIKRELGVRASGPKAELARRIAERAQAVAGAVGDKTTLKPRSVTETVDAVRSALGKPASPDDLARLASYMAGHTAAELVEIKRSLGLAASGPKAELARKIAERAALRAQGDTRFGPQAPRGVAKPVATADAITAGMSPRGIDAVESAAHNLRGQEAPIGDLLTHLDGIDPGSDEYYQARRHLARQLSESWDDMGRNADKYTDADRDRMADLIRRAVPGIEQTGAPGERTSFRGDVHAGPAGLFTDDAVSIRHPGWRIKEGPDQWHVVSRGSVEPAGPAPTNPTPPGSPEWESRMAGLDPRDSGAAPEPAKPDRPYVDTEAYDAAKDKLDRMEAWAADKPDSEAARGAVDRARERVRQAEAVVPEKPPVKVQPVAAGQTQPAEPPPVTPPTGTDRISESVRGAVARQDAGGKWRRGEPLTDTEIQDLMTMDGSGHVTEGRGLTALTNRLGLTDDEARSVLASVKPVTTLTVGGNRKRPGYSVVDLARAAEKMRNGKPPQQSPENQSRPVDKPAGDSNIPVSGQPGTPPGADAGGGKMNLGSLQNDLRNAVMVRDHARAKQAADAIAEMTGKRPVLPTDYGSVLDSVQKIGKEIGAFGLSIDIDHRGAYVIVRDPRSGNTGVAAISSMDDADIRNAVLGVTGNLKRANRQTARRVRGERELDRS